MLDLPEQAIVVRGDAARLAQVIQNLLSNAARYGPDGRPIAVQATTAEGHVWVTVTDEGIGLTPDQQERVFEKFYRGQSPVMHQRPGIGLGLAISRHIVEAHGGRIWAESDGPGQGTSFRFILPLLAGFATATNPAAASSAPE